MTIEKPAPWVGASGAEYSFEVFDLEAGVPPRLGIYIYAKRNEEGAWVPLYMGAGDLAAGCMDASLRQNIDVMQPTHIHLRLMKREEDRIEELRDLLAHYENAFAPDGCQPETDRPAPSTEPASLSAPAD